MPVMRSNGVLLYAGIAVMTFLLWQRVFRKPRWEFDMVLGTAACALNER